MQAQDAKIILGAMQMFEHLIKEPNAYKLAIDSFCLVWNRIADVAYPDPIEREKQ